jgi:hypothetical protein
LSVILDALVKLEESLDTLEGTVVQLESSMAGQQRDMFGGPPVAANANALDKKAVVEKLDQIIEQAEGVLKEANA